LCGNCQAELGASQGVFCVASVDGIAGEGGEIAEVFLGPATVRAGAVGAAKPGDAYAGAYTGRYGVEVAGYYFAYDLVARDDSWVAGREFAFDDVGVGAADSAGEYFEENVAWFRFGGGNVFDFQWGLGDWSGSGEDCGFHVLSQILV